MSTVFDNKIFLSKKEEAKHEKYKSTGVHIACAKCNLHEGAYFKECIKGEHRFKVFVLPCELKPQRSKNVCYL